MLYQQRKSLLVFLVGFFVLSGGAYGKRIGERKEVKRKLLTINVVGGTGDPPESALPLGLCEGDCDNNAEVGVSISSAVLASNTNRRFC